MIPTHPQRIPCHAALAALVLACSAAIGCSQSANPVGPSLSVEGAPGELNARPGDAGGSDVGKMLYKFNVIAVPQSDWVVDDSECTNQGHRIFFERGNGNTLGTILWRLYEDLNPSFQIQDCDGTNDTTAEIWANESQRFYVMVRLLGPKTSTLTIVCDDIIDEGADDLCLIDGGAVNLQRNAMTKIMENIVDDEYEEVLWTLSGNWRIFEVRIYEKL